MTVYHKVEGSTTLVRDPSNRAVLNTNNKEVIAYRQHRELRIKKEETMQGVIEDINSVKDELVDLAQNLLAHNAPKAAIKPITVEDTLK